MRLLPVVRLALLAAVAPLPARLPAQPTVRDVAPVLAFPEAGLDDPTAYQGYQTRFFRDAAGNTVQIYLDRRAHRVVTLLANAENESVGFTPRAPGGAPVALRWDAPGAAVAGPGAGAAGRRTIAYALVADAPHVHLGWFLLGSMRVERDFQHFKHQETAFGGAAFPRPELDRLLAALDGLDPATRRRHLAHLRAPDVATLRARRRPRVTTAATPTRWTARVAQPSLDGRDTLVLELAVDPRRVAATRAGDSLSLRARTGTTVPFTVRVTTTGAPLTPLARAELFTPEFLAFVDDAARAGAAPGAPDSARLRARWLERQVRGVELLASREKFMAGLPTYATYFGRDMLVTALMMRGIWRPDATEAVIGSVLRKLGPDGGVSHEEALGEQAVREAAAEYATLVDASRAARGAGRPGADSLLARAEAVLRDHRRVRENHHMIDDELHLPVVVARWIADPAIPDARKRAFLLDSSDGGGTRLARLLRELALVGRRTAPYAADPVAANLIPFGRRDDGAGWAATSWRDSGVGYAGGRFAMDVNAIWVPHALDGLGEILRRVRALGLPLDAAAAATPELAPTTPIGAWLRDSLALRRAADAWRGAARHFLVRLGPDSVRAAVAARVAAMPADERAHWTAVLAETRADRDSLAFLALALDATGRPIGVANTDPATRLFLGDAGAGGAAGATPPTDAEAAAVLRDVRLFTRAYPVGLFIDRVGPVVANDAYAPPAVWDAFVRDPYHGPRVVWGREVNLFLLGAAERVAAAGSDPRLAPYVRELRAAMARVTAAVQASGFRSELWSYAMLDGRLSPVRYGSGADVQLWSTTDLAVQFALSRLGR